MMYYLVYGLTHLVLLDINLKDAAKVLIDTLTLGPRSQADSLNPLLYFKLKKLVGQFFSNSIY